MHTSQPLPEHAALQDSMSCYRQHYSDSIMLDMKWGSSSHHKPISQAELPYARRWAAAIVSTAIPAFYCVTGGMRASLLTDFYQVGG